MPGPATASQRRLCSGPRGCAAPAGAGNPRSQLGVGDFPKADGSPRGGGWGGGDEPCPASMELLAGVVQEPPTPNAPGLGPQALEQGRVPTPGFQCHPPRHESPALFSPSIGARIQPPDQDPCPCPTPPLPSPRSPSLSGRPSCGEGPTQTPVGNLLLGPVSVSWLRTHGSGGRRGEGVGPTKKLGV